MYCKKCGKEIVEKTKYCKYCGSEINESEVFNASVSVPTTQTKESRKDNVKSIIICSVLLLILIMAAICPALCAGYDTFSVWRITVSTYEKGKYFENKKYNLIYKEQRGKLGLMHIDGEIVIPCEYENIWYNEKQNLIMAIRDEEWVTDIWSEDGEKLLSLEGMVNEERCTNEFFCVFSDRYAWEDNGMADSTEMTDGESERIYWNGDFWIPTDEKVDYVDIRGNVIVEDVSRVEQCGKLYVVCNENGNWSDPDYEKSYYLMNEKGEQVSEIFKAWNCYDEESHIFQFKTQEGGFNYLNEKGEIIATSQVDWRYYDGMINGGFKVGSYSEYWGIASRMEHGAYMILPTEYCDVDGGNGVYWASKEFEQNGGKVKLYAFFDENGWQLTDFAYTSVQFEKNHIEAQRESGEKDIYYLNDGMASLKYSIEEDEQISIWKVNNQYRYIVYGEELGKDKISIYDEVGNCLFEKRVDQSSASEKCALLAVRYTGEEDKVHIFDVTNCTEIRVLEHSRYTKLLKDGMSYYDRKAHKYIVESFERDSQSESGEWKELLRTGWTVSVNGSVYSVEINGHEAYYRGKK